MGGGWVDCFLKQERLLFSMHHSVPVNKHTLKKVSLRLYRVKGLLTPVMYRKCCLCSQRFLKQRLEQRERHPEELEPTEYSKSFLRSRNMIVANCTWEKTLKGILQPFFLAFVSV